MDVLNVIVLVVSVITGMMSILSVPVGVYVSLKIQEVKLAALAREVRENKKLAEAGHTTQQEAWQTREGQVAQSLNSMRTEFNTLIRECSAKIDALSKAVAHLEGRQNIRDRVGDIG